MSRVFDREGNVLPVTLLLRMPIKVQRIITKEKNGYNAVVVEEVKSKNKDKKVTKSYNTEFAINEIDKFKVGDEIKLSDFAAGDEVSVVGTGKGKGFAGTVKRHNFTTGPKTHGSNNYREPGSIGGGYPQRVVLGKKMPGRMGGKQVSIKNIKIVDISETDSIISLAGPIPGPKNSIVKILAE